MLNLSMSEHNKSFKQDKKQPVFGRPFLLIHNTVTGFYGFHRVTYLSLPLSVNAWF